MFVVRLCCSFVFHKILVTTIHLIHSAGLKLKTVLYGGSTYDQKLFILCLILIVVCWAEEEHF